jgi:hypothetical protein
MQKTKEASILIWSLFLSLFIAFAFVSFSVSVHSAIQNVYTISQDITKNFLIHQNIYQAGFVQTSLSSTEQMVSDSSHILFLQDRQATEVRFIGSITPKITFSMYQWGPIFYTFVSFKNSSLIGSITASWIVTENASFDGIIRSWDDRGILYVKNLWGATKFTYTSTITSIDPVSSYKTLVNIWWKYLQKQTFEKRNFIPWDYSWFPYTQFEMFF